MRSKQMEKIYSNLEIMFFIKERQVSLKRLATPADLCTSIHKIFKNPLSLTNCLFSKKQQNLLLLLFDLEFQSSICISYKQIDNHKTTKSIFGINEYIILEIIYFIL